MTVIPDDPRALLVPNGVGTDWVTLQEWARANDIPRGTRLQLPGTLTPEQMRRLQEIRNGKFFLVRNDGGETRERLACGNHVSTGAMKGSIQMGPLVHFKPVFHDYFTLCCVKRPFRGLEKALYAWSVARHDDDVERTLLRRYPSLAGGHPWLARALAPREPGEDLLAIALGTVEPIREPEARILERNIRSLQSAVRPADRFVL